MWPLIAAAAIVGSKMLGSYMGNKKGGYHDAKKEARRYWDEQKGFEQPYMNNGVNQIGRLNGAEDRLLDPYSLQNEWGSQYEKSPYAQQLLQENQSNGMDAASSMGLMGSSAAINNIQKGAGNIVNADRQQYMNDMMQKYMTGIGLGENMYGVGANAANTLAGGAQHQGDLQSGLKFGESTANGQMFKDMLGAFSGGLSSYMSGGMGGGGMGSGMGGS